MVHITLDDKEIAVLRMLIGVGSLAVAHSLDDFLVPTSFFRLQTLKNYDDVLAKYNLSNKDMSQIVIDFCKIVEKSVE